jgi:hypothetical protein
MNNPIKVPAHLWIVGVLSLLWNAYGGFDYLMTQTNNAAYLANFTQEQRDYFASFPAWADACWAFGVWGSVAGSILLLLRNRHAATAFAISLAGLALSTIYQWLISPVSATAIMGSVGIYLTMVIWIVVIALLLYSVRMRNAGVLH